MTSDTRTHTSAHHLSTAESPPKEQQGTVFKTHTSCSIVCPHCGEAMTWHYDGKIWHGHCAGCMRTLRGNYPECEYMDYTYIPEADVLLGARGC